jgi:hypothetical protein
LELEEVWDINKKAFMDSMPMTLPFPLEQESRKVRKP